MLATFVLGLGLQWPAWLLAVAIISAMYADRLIAGLWAVTTDRGKP